MVSVQLSEKLSSHGNIFVQNEEKTETVAENGNIQLSSISRNFSIEILSNSQRDSYFNFTCSREGPKRIVFFTASPILSKYDAPGELKIQLSSGLLYRTVQELAICVQDSAEILDNIQAGNFYPKSNIFVKFGKLNHIISIITFGNRNFIGTLKNFDQTINILLDESHKRVHSITQDVEQENWNAHLDLSDIRADPSSFIVH
ncbi:hypothetical protein E2986_13930 [Frieseomelitta varia]|uniref:Sm domain-containing protein n=1 Tax=Frieseomelitta varia TaxID=561572 RepID=A0A833RWC2_9HYME|nr:hypothetical protein E2986_13930 [Frieseomelitta varia]